MKERILKGAEEAFMRYGIKSMTMDEISKNLGISKKTIYQYFQDKNELVLKVVESHMNDERTKMEKMSDEAENSIHEMVLVSRYMKSSIVDMNPSVIIDMQKFYPEAWSYFESHKHECITESIKKNLDKGISEGHYRPDINTEILSRFRVEQVSLGYDTGIFPRDLISPLEVQLELMNHFFMGVVTPKGLELFNKYLKENVQ